mgnify:CR=1 FL=1|jgi:hypothetical protein
MGKVRLELTTRLRVDLEDLDWGSLMPPAAFNSKSMCSALWAVVRVACQRCFAVVFPSEAASPCS